MKKVNLFIVGAAKAGTSALWSILSQHPSIFAAKDSLYKEPAFFSPLARRKKMTQSLYDSIYKNAKNYNYLLDASTAYLSDPQSAQEIYNYNKDAKIIICLRNPVDRAYSLYNWMVQEGYEYLSFKKALESEFKRSKNSQKSFWKPEYHYNYQYLNSGKYYEQVNRYIQLFDNQVCIIFFEDLKSSFQEQMNLTTHFLGIKNLEFINKSTNVSKHIPFPLFQFLIRKINNVLVEILPINNSKQKRDMLLNLFISNRKPNKLPSEIRLELERFYYDDIIKLEKLINKQITWFKAD